MPRHAIALNATIALDIERLIQGRLAILANSGGGKSYAIRRVAEQAAGKIQTIILDDEGEFSTLREKHDFILCGEGQDVPVEIRSAAMLATMLLEAKASAVIDLSELMPKDKKTFVSIFLGTMVRAPKTLWHPCLIILDEAHDYAPEGKPSEASAAVESMASKGRKRGYVLVPASQRISKISKDVLSECSNVLIGKATWKIDRKRAAEELGLNKEEELALKKFKPGEFYATGPAISDDLIRIQVGPVKTSHGKTLATYESVPPSPGLRKALAKLADLPAEVEKEATTSAELKEQVRKLKSELSHAARPVAPTVDIEAEVEKRLALHITAIESEREGWRQTVQNWKHFALKLHDAMVDVDIARKEIFKNMPSEKPGGTYKPPEKKVVVVKPEPNAPYQGPQVEAIFHDEASVPNGPEQRILDAIAWFESIGVQNPEQPAVAFLAGYSWNSSSFNNPRGAMRRKGWVEIEGKALVLTATGRVLAQKPTSAPTREELHSKVLSVLPGPEQRLLRPLLAAYPEGIPNDELAIAAEYSPGSSSFNNPRGRLRTLGLIELKNGIINARSILFP